jgi:thymidylate synthase
MNKREQQYLDLLQDILDNGEEQDDRTGTGTISVFGRMMRFNMQDGFPLLTTKKMFTKGIFTELLWFLSGETNIKPLLEQGNKIWVGDAYKKLVSFFDYSTSEVPFNKEEFIQEILINKHFAKQWGELGPVYGKQWRNWNGVDQIQQAIDTLRTNSSSRRILVNAWHVDEIPKMTLPPCHYGFQLRASNKKLDLMVNIRSNDIPLGNPFNVASYALLLHIFAKMTNLIPNDLIVVIGDTHIYKNQIEGIKEQLKRDPKPFPTLKFSYDINFDGTIDDFLDSCTWEDFIIDGYDPHPTIKMPLSN